ncbi:hypothetical protein [Burkholderia sp. BCC0405]|uniref:hypothetical protein n=1 Tax=Burkholderia sp. BCC0405 TaxID=2676298 RepID=UPI001FC87FA7|nr:hypothetical protein [Burkholderia sp. BCC0405]
MKINEQRNIALPVVTELVTRKVPKEIDGKEELIDETEEVVRVWAYHTPISREVFDANFRVLAATKSALAGKGSHYLSSSGPRIAALTLRDEGKKDAAARGSFDKDGIVKDDDTAALLGEFKRLTMILCPGQHGWDLLPVDAAIQQGRIDSEDWEEALASIVFFTCLYAMARKADREMMAKGTASLIGALITSSAPMEFAASLQTSMHHEHTKRTQSSIPS